MSTLFQFVARDHAAQFGKHGYALIRNAVTVDFLDYVKGQLAQCVREAEDLSPKVEQRRLKQQFLFEFRDHDLFDRAVELVTTIGELTGLPADELILSERHLKIYRADAPQNPPPHKDRRATQVAVGIPLEMPSVSRLILYPYHQRSENPFDSYDEFIRWLPEEQRPQNALKGVAPVELDTRPGDLIVFWGSSMYHQRMGDVAGSQVLYLKLNALGLDPLGENLPMLPLKSRRVAVGRTEATAAVETTASA